MSHHEANKIKRKLAPFMRLLMAVACMGLLASCGGGGGGGGVAQDSTPAITTSYAKVVKESDFVTAPNGVTAVNKQLELTAKDGVAYQTVTDYINQNGWTLVGHVAAAGVYQVDVGATDWATSKAVAEKSGLFDFVDYDEKVKFDTIESRWNDPLLKSVVGRWNLDAINIDQAYSVLNQSGGYSKVAVIDGGFRTDHQDISFSSVQNSSGEKINQAEGCSLSFPSDNYSCPTDAKKSAANHGMNVAGIIGASQNNNIGVAGVATPFVQLNSYELASNGEVIANIAKAIGDGNKIINLSLNKKIAEYSDVVCTSSSCTVSSSAYSKYAYDAAKFGKQLYSILKALDKDETVLFIKSSGNDADLAINVNGQSFAKTPSRFNGLHTAVVSSEFMADTTARQRIARQTIFVGAFHMDSGTKALANYTELPDSDSLISGNFILAPGGSNVSGGATPGVLSAGYTKSYNNDYLYLTAGTSQATPHVSGVAALVLKANPKLAASQVRDIIVTNSDTVDGYRALNAEKAVRAALDTLTKPTVSFTPSTLTPKVGDEVTFTANASSANGAINLYSWSFGDGATSLGNTTNTIKHTFTTTGNFAVFVNVQDVVGAQAKSDNISITPVSPIPTPTVTGITAPSTVTVGVNATFSINGTNFPTTENLVITPTGVGCTGFGYGTRSATAHTFACTPSSAGTLTFVVTTASSALLGSFDVTVASAVTEKYSLVSNGTGGFYDKNECVKDTATGLIWEGKTTDSSIRDYSAVLSMSAAVSNNVANYIQSVNAMNLCGYSNWRLPTITELQSLLDQTAAPIKINQTWFPNTNVGSASWGYGYWSSTNVYSPQDWYILSFLSGNTAAYGLGGYQAVRLVH